MEKDEQNTGLRGGGGGGGGRVTGQEKVLGEE